MVTYLPISSPFIRFAGRYVDDAFGFAAGWNFFVFEAALVPFEIVACNVIIGFWSDAVPTGAIIAIVLVLYAYVDPCTTRYLTWDTKEPFVLGCEPQTIHIPLFLSQLCPVCTLGLRAHQTSPSVLEYPMKSVREPGLTKR